MDNAVLREAAAQLVAEPVTARSIYDRLNTDYALMLHEVFDGQPGAPARLRFRALIDATDERNRGERHLEQLSQFVRALSAREGRKALVWVSAGLQTSEGGAFSAIVAQTLGTGQVVNGLPGGQNRGATPTPELTFNDHMMPHARSRDLQEALYATANASNVAIYAVDPTPKHRYRRTATAAARNVQVSDVMSSPTVQGAIDSTRGVLTEAARETGGRSFIGWSELDTALDELATDTSAYYLLYYVPSTTRAPGTYHEIDVEVAFPDADVRARPGYLETTPEEARAERVAAALALPGLLFSQGLDSAVYRRVGSADEVSAWLALHVPAFVPEPFSDGEPVPALRLHLLALDENAVVQHEERLEIRSRGGSATDSIDGGIDYVHELKLERGDYELRVAVEEIVSGRLLGARLQLHASAPDEGSWEASDLVPIAAALGGRRELSSRAACGRYRPLRRGVGSLRGGWWWQRAGAVGAGASARRACSDGAACAAAAAKGRRIGSPLRRPECSAAAGRRVHPSGDSHRPPRQPVPTIRASAHRGTAIGWRARHCGDRSARRRCKVGR